MQQVTGIIILTQMSTCKGEYYNLKFTIYKDTLDEVYKFKS